MKNISIKYKLILIVFVTVLLVVTSGLIAILTYEINEEKTNLANEVLTGTKLVGEICVSPLSFYDQNGAHKLLTKIFTIEQVNECWLYDSNDAIFAMVSRSSTQDSLPRPNLEINGTYEGDYLYIIQPINYNNKLYGYIFVKASVLKMEDQLSDYKLTMVLVFLTMLIVSFFLANRFQRTLSQPILDLAQVINNISSTQDYSKRVEYNGADEIAQLYHGFNNMMGQIQKKSRERDLAQQELETNEAKQKAMLENISDVIAIIDKDGIIRYKSNNIEKWFGWKPKELIGRSTWELLHPDSLEYANNIFNELIKVENVFKTMEVKYKCKNGEYKWVKSTAVNRINDPNIKGVLMNYHDISERKKTEAIILQKQNELLEAQHMAKIGNFYEDLVAKTLYWSDESYLIWGVEPGHTITSDFILTLIHPDDLHLLTKARNDAQKGNPETLLEFRIKRPDGKICYIHDHWVSTYDENGIEIERSGTHQDITEHKLAEEQIQQDLKVKEVLLKEVHHRVKNNLTVITSLLSLQARTITDKEQAFEAFNESRNRIISMALVHEHLYRSDDFSKVDMKKYIETLAIDLKHTLAPEKNIELNMDVKDVQLDVNNAIPCGLVLNELLTNIYKHAFPNSNNGKVNISFQSDSNSTYELIVQDNGRGLPENFNIENSNTLGLQLMHMLSQQLDGKMTVKNQDGATFKIRFKIDQN